MSLANRIQSPSRLSRYSRLTARSTRSGFGPTVKVLPDFDKCQDYGISFPKEHPFVDNRDVSLHPSYTELKIPYNIVCEARYSRAKSQIEEQLQKELKQLLDSMDSAYEAARFMRHMCITTFWPPLHNRSEIQETQTRFFKLNKNQRKHLNSLLETKIL